MRRLEYEHRHLAVQVLNAYGEVMSGGKKPSQDNEHPAKITGRGNKISSDQMLSNLGAVAVDAKETLNGNPAR